MDDTPAIEARGLVKTFGANRAVDGLDLYVPRGGVFGVLGPNGAGKTTTIRMLATLLRPDGGVARVLGHDVAAEPDAVRRRVGLTGQFASLDEDLTGVENLRLLARLLGFSIRRARGRADELLAIFDLTEAGRRRVKDYSGGMRRRLDIAASLLATPDLLFLDEPTTGLDPRSRNQVWAVVRALVAAGTTVLLTTQYLEEADQLADRIAVIDHGRVIAEGTSDELKGRVGEGVLTLRLAHTAQRDEAVALLTPLFDAAPEVADEPGALTFHAATSEQAARALEALNGAGMAVSRFSLGQPSLDEVFLALTGHPAVDESVEDEEVSA
ncbi:MAG: ATP-binding cassette domain-containing protein [Pseudomonadota bacterium]